MSKFEPKLIKNKKPRSNFNLSRVNRFTCSPMLAIPVAWEEVLPDDTFIYGIESRVQTDSLLSPALVNFKVQYHAFFCPDRLYSKRMNYNPVTRMGDGGNLFTRDYPLPRIAWPGNSSIDNTDASHEYFEYTKVRPASLADYLGIPVGFVNRQLSELNINALPFISYYDIVRNYFIHQQSGYCRIMNNRFVYDNEPVDNVTPGYVEYSLEILDNLIEKFFDGEVDWATAAEDKFSLAMLTQGEFAGLACTTYMPDQFRNYLSNTTVAQLATLAKVDVVEATNGSHVTVDDIIFANHLYRYLAVSVLGGNSTYTDWLNAHWGITIDTAITKPEYLGTTTTWVKFGEVISTSNIVAEDSDSVTGLGDRGGVGFGYGKGRKRKFHFKEPGTFMIIQTIVPELDYSQGIRKALRKVNMSDRFVPELDGIGYQDIAVSELCALPNLDYTSSETDPKFMPWTSSDSVTTPTFNPLHTSFGKQPAWMEYKTAQNEVHGRLVPTENLGYWTAALDFRQRLRVSGELEDYTTYNVSPYGKPWDFNYLFNNTDDYASNFICEVKIDLIAKRQMNKNIIPSLSI